MALLNYTTQIAAQKTVSEIQTLLCKAKASAVLTEYDPAGVLSAISFRITKAHGLMSFRLPWLIIKKGVGEEMADKLRNKYGDRLNG